MSCRMSGDPRWRGCGMVAAWSGPSGVRWLVQLAAASAMPAAASTLARVDGRRGCWCGMSWVLVSSGIRMRWCWCLVWKCSRGRGY